MAKQIDWEKVLHNASTAGRRAILENYDQISRRKVVMRGVGGDLTLRIDEVSERAIHDSLKSEILARVLLCFSPKNLAR